MRKGTETKKGFGVFVWIFLLIIFIFTFYLVAIEQTKEKQNPQINKINNKYREIKEEGGEGEEEEAALILALPNSTLQIEFINGTPSFTLTSPPFPGFYMNLFVTSIELLEINVTSNEENLLYSFPPPIYSSSLFNYTVEYSSPNSSLQFTPPLSPPSKSLQNFTSKLNIDLCPSLSLNLTSENENSTNFQCNFITGVHFEATLENNATLLANSLLVEKESLVFFKGLNLAANDSSSYSLLHSDWIFFMFAFENWPVDFDYSLLSPPYYNYSSSSDQNYYNNMKNNDKIEDKFVINSSDVDRNNGNNNNRNSDQNRNQNLNNEIKNKDKNNESNKEIGGKERGNGKEKRKEERGEEGGEGGEMIKMFRVIISMKTSEGGLGAAMSFYPPLTSFYHSWKNLFHVSVERSAQFFAIFFYENVIYNFFSEAGGEGGEGGGGGEEVEGYAHIYAHVDRISAPLQSTTKIDIPIYRYDNLSFISFSYEGILIETHPHLKTSSVKETIIVCSLAAILLIIFFIFLYLFAVCFNRKLRKESNQNDDQIELHLISSSNSDQQNEIVDQSNVNHFQSDLEDDQEVKINIENDPMNEEINVELEKEEEKEEDIH